MSTRSSTRYFSLGSVQLQPAPSSHRNLQSSFLPKAKTNLWWDTYNVIDTVSVYPLVSSNMAGTSLINEVLNGKITNKWSVFQCHGWLQEGIHNMISACPHANTVRNLVHCYNPSSQARPSRHQQIWFSMFLYENRVPQMLMNYVIWFVFRVYGKLIARRSPYTCVIGYIHLFDN